MTNLCRLLRGVVGVLTFFVATAFSTAPAIAGAVTLLIEDGELIGAEGVMVGEEIYDVQFLDGSCVSLFDTCGGGIVGPFGPNPIALVAAQALLDQVLLDVALGDFDSAPALVRGCSDPNLCQIILPTDLPGGSNVNGLRIVNNSDEMLDAVLNVTAIGLLTDTAISSVFTYAVFTLSTAATTGDDISEVPLPGAFAFLLSGLFGLGLARGKKQATRGA